MWWRLLYPLRYFALKNTEKRHIDLWPTLGLTMAIASPFIFLNGAVFFHAGGFLDKLLGFAAALTGFYVAALVAAATFTNADFDKVITVGAIKIRKKKVNDDDDEFEYLTRRDFTTTLFGYLAFNSLVLAVGAVVFCALAGADLSPLSQIPWVGGIFSPEALRVWRAVIILFFSATTAHLIVVTCLGLYYLMGRMYHRRPRVISQKHDQEAA